MVGTHAAGDVPWIGEWVTRLFKGGAEVSGLTLTRFYSIHMLVLPALFIGLIAAHIYLVRVHGLSVSDRVRPEEMKRPYAFFPEHMQKSSTIFAVLLAAVFALAYLLGVSRENVAGTIDPSYLPRPEWYYMWLFQLLTYFSGPLEVIGTVLIPIGGLCIVIAVPFLEKNTHHQPGKRPVPVALGVTGLMALIFLTLMGFDGARSYGQEVVVPKRVLTAAESKGLNVFVHEECSYCHTILGRGGRRSGPDLSNVVAKGRDREWLSRAISNPQTLSAWNEMPAYELNNDDLESLVAFLQALDFRDGHRLQRVGKNKAP
ncbi:MAG: hypothetical protein A2289_12595 [Deltaproteobacteria bacterium RIFOXYA12_FULL_58_15]|nr:MAG: hypothetical protein A2289_12595 [Deltaproteobacteria bacterium RIFOXYA12_FULL_58_15]